MLNLYTPAVFSAIRDVVNWLRVVCGCSKVVRHIFRDSQGVVVSSGGAYAVHALYVVIADLFPPCHNPAGKAIT